MTRRYSAIRSRCSCGHKIILKDGHWQHVEPHPETACTCMEPKPSEHIGQFRAHGEPLVRCGISTLGRTMERHESEVGL